MNFYENKHEVNQRWCTLTIRVEDTGDTDVDVVLAVEGICECFRNSLAFIITSAWTDRIDVTPAYKVEIRTGK